MKNKSIMRVLVSLNLNNIAIVKSKLYLQVFWRCWKFYWILVKAFFKIINWADVIVKTWSSNNTVQKFFFKDFLAEFSTIFDCLIRKCLWKVWFLKVFEIPKFYIFHNFLICFYTYNEVGHSIKACKLFKVFHMDIGW